MTVLQCTVVVVLGSLCVSALPADHSSEAVLSPGGSVLRAGRKMMRRDEALGTDGELDETSDHLLYGVSDMELRSKKMERGLAAAHNTNEDPWAVTVGKHANTGKSRRPWHEAPRWEPHPSMPTMPTCVQDVTTDMGLSDYGTIKHSCAACAGNCTEENKQAAINHTWQFEPSLEDCNAFDVKLFVNWSNIEQLGCSDCGGKGLKHKFEFSIATNAGDNATGYDDVTLSFDGWMGPEVEGGPRGSGSDFNGHHVFEIEDTEEPSRSDDCEAESPKGRWLAIPGELRSGETFHCERFCKSSHPCKCGRNTGMRCTAGIAMGSSQLFAYRLRSIAESATGTLDGLDYVGTEWEVTAEDLSQASPVMTVGRVVLAGNAAVFGIKGMKQSHQHIGCVPCDLFYESTIVSGPFIEDPVGVHVIKSSTGFPPELTEESCELFRISSMGGFAVKFESGPGLWPPFEVNDTIFTCDHTSTNTCPA